MILGGFVVRINFTLAQRVVLLSGAAVIAWFLIVQSEEVGLQGVAWLLGAVLLVSLAVLAFRPAEKSMDRNPARPPAIDREALGPLVDQLTQSSLSFLERKLPYVNVTPLTAMEGMRLCYREAALKMAFMVVALVAAKRHRDFMGSDEKKYLEIITAGRLAVLIEKDLNPAGSVPVSDPRGLALKAATRDMVSCLLAIDATMNNFLKASTYPTDPIFLIINKQVPIVPDKGGAEGRSTMYRPLFTSMWELAEQRV